MPVETHVVNFDNIADKRAVIARIGVLSGQWRVELTRYRPRRTDRQNRWYFPAICGALATYMSEQDYDRVTPEMAHEIFKSRFLEIDVINRVTGETIGKRVRSTTELTTAEFADYCERCRAWLADFFGVVVPNPPGDAWEDRPEDKEARMGG